MKINKIIRIHVLFLTLCCILLQFSCNSLTMQSNNFSTEKIDDVLQYQHSQKFIPIRQNKLKFLISINSFKNKLPKSLTFKFINTSNEKITFTLPKKLTFADPSKMEKQNSIRGYSYSFKFSGPENIKGEFIYLNNDNFKIQENQNISIKPKKAIEIKVDINDFYIIRRCNFYKFTEFFKPNSGIYEMTIFIMYYDLKLKRQVICSLKKAFRYFLLCFVTEF